MRRIKTKAFSLVEVVVASVIFMIAAAGAFKVFSIAQKMSTVSSDEVIAANYGRGLLESLRARVDQRTWNSGWYLSCDDAWHSWPATPTNTEPFYNLSGNVDYRCTENATTGTRKVTMNIVW